ncbi:DUF5681 domain-containing protein [Defluviimonas aestuarii]|uniref:DUF5681 domain-containing protein n=1 Tax=Albidovulum aestuarii TaxID=1130726 RepID=UPI00249AB654|nr:DUF5681 domain-containing protein [Defluviimonas aestuarii]MDI3335663.1 DUF5681 domain-containing protein [Defluviimonas aestuarii]
MSGQGGDKQSRALALRPGYEVGYAKPPEASRFRPGQSGNPLGRPKGTKNRRPALHEERMKDIILDEAYRTITVRDGDRNVTVPMAQAIMRSLAVNAARGQHRAQRLFAELLAATERSRADLQERYIGAALDYKIAWERELARRDALGITDQPPPLPHPDHVIVDVRNGTVRMVGPATKEEKAEWDAILAEKAVLEDSVAQLRQANETETDPEEIADNLRYIALGEEKLVLVRKIMPG